MLRSLLLGVVCLGVGLASAQARPNRSASAEQPATPAEPVVRPVSAMITEGQPVCTHTRRRLWLEGEGWVVRKIPNCR